MLPKKSHKIFRWPEMYALGKVLAQYFEIAGATKILACINCCAASLYGKLSNTPNKNVHSMYGGDCDAAIAKAAAADSRTKPEFWGWGSGLVWF